MRIYLLIHKSYTTDIYKSFGLEAPANAEEGFDFRQFCSLLKALICL